MTRLTITMPIALYERLKQFKRINCISVSALIAKLLNDYMGGDFGVTDCEK